MSANGEATKDTTRMALFGAVSTVITYIVNLFLPDLPENVLSAILVIVTLGLVYVDSAIHNSDSKVNGLVNF